MNWGRWAVILLLVMLACAVVGFLIDTVRLVAGFLFVVCLIILVARMATRRS